MSTSQPETPLAFDNEKYLAEQTAAILERIDCSDNKLYLEFGGKLLFDYHASRVLPGFDPNVKMRLLRQLRDKAEMLLCVHAGAIAATRADGLERTSGNGHRASRTTDPG